MIGDELEYWDRVRTPAALRVGVTVQWAQLGYQTFLIWVQENELSDERELNIAKQAAGEFQTDVAIGNLVCSEELPGEFLMIEKAGTVFGSDEVSNSDVFELSATGPPRQPSDVIRMLRLKT